MLRSKILSSTAALALLAGLTSCGSDSSGESSPGESTNTAADRVETSSPESTALAYVRAWYEQDCDVMTQVLVAEEVVESFPPNGECSADAFADFVAEGDWTDPVEQLDYSVKKVGAGADETEVTVEVSSDPDAWTV